MKDSKSLRAGFGVKFQEAIEYFKTKARVPTQEWTDIMGARHGQSFVVAGAMKDSLLEDFQTAILKAIEDGTTLETFRKDFDKIVARHGWRYKGGRRWRTAVIYNTNLRQAHMAGHWKRIWEGRGDRPFLRYVALKSGDRRPEHQALHGLIRPVEDTIWKTIMPMNGWGCKCTVQPLSQEEMDRKGYELTAQSPKLEYEERTINARWGPFTANVPKGFDPGFDYNPGYASWGERVGTQAIEAQKAAGGRRWESLDKATWREWGRPEQVPVDDPVAKLGPTTADTEDLKKSLRVILGGDEKTFKTPDGTPVLISADALAQHIDVKRGAFLPFLPEILENPFEVWVAAEREVLSGKVVIRKRVVKILKGPDKNRGVAVVMNVDKGFFTGWTFFLVRKGTTLNKIRSGLLTWGRSDESD